jgi:hypothetical protein
MAATLHRAGFEQARRLLRSGKVVADQRDAWSEHQPSAQEENDFIRRHGIAEYGRWHLGIDSTRAPYTKAHYKFPYGDFARLHRCALLSAESRAGRYKYFDIEKAAHRLHVMIDLKASSRSPAQGTQPRPRSATR